MKKIYSLLAFLIVAQLSFAQLTLPLPYALAASNYSFTSWDPLSPAGTYPANMVFHYTISSENPSYNHLAEAARNFDCSYNLTARNRILGFADSGIAFLATSSAQYNDCTSGLADTNRYVGDAVLGINSLGKTGVQVKWTGIVYTTGDGSGNLDSARQATVRLQYRIGITGNYTDVVNGSDTLECRSTGKAAKTVVSVSGTLPSICDNQPLVYLRWVYFSIPVATGSKGTRPEILVDDISVGSGVLPVNLLSFGVANSNGAAALSWKTANEVNFSHFEIQRSSNGAAYSTIASVTANGNSTGNTYSITDTKAATGNNYYRLKMVNRDGTYSYSTVVMFTVSGLHMLGVTPNPVSGKFTLAHPQASANAMITIFGFDGKKMASYKVAVNAVQTTINASSLSRGNYFLLFANGAQKLTAKFTKN